ncbi:MAG: two pore domain potassium channel family protein, partial [Candidatus Omnitrophica bacterium]|nr:two pore domain potassium channel family protein [Candidatus Omnitrophota bacterium]
AKEAETHFNYEYAATLYKQAAIYYERDGEFTHYAECFYEAKESNRKALGYLFLKSRKHHVAQGSRDFNAFLATLKLVLKWCLLTASYLIWGHGEKPTRTLLVSMSVILSASILFSFCSLAKNGVPFIPNYFDALYLSVVTFATIGYGDITPLGPAKLVAMAEAFGSMFLLPLFLVGFSRKYLRV